MLHHSPLAFCFNLIVFYIFLCCFLFILIYNRGCSAQYAGVLDSPWSNVVDAIDNLVTTHIRSDTGIVTVIKQLDSKLSETIMRAMENGPELETKVSFHSVIHLQMFETKNIQKQFTN